MGVPGPNMSSTKGYATTPTEEFSVIEIPELRATDPAYYWKVSTAFLGVVAVSFIVSTIAVSGHSTETVDATPDGNAGATELMWGRPATPKCEGAGTLPGAGPLCYNVKVGMFGVTEAIDMKITRSTQSAGSAGETGKMDLTGSGVSSFRCVGVDITKNGQTCNPDVDQLKNCLPHGVTLESADYCSNTDQVQVKIKDSNFPSPAITATASRVKCDSSPDGNAEATDLWGKSSTPDSPEKCGKAINVNIRDVDEPPWVTGKYNFSTGQIYIGGYYNTFAKTKEAESYDKKHWPNRLKQFPDAHIQTWRNSGWDCKGNDQGGCNGDRDQWLTLGCDFCDAEAAKAAAGKWAIWHTVGHSTAKCGREMEDKIWVKGGCDNPEGACHESHYIDGNMTEGCDQDTIPRHGMVKLIATYDDRHFWSPKIWTDYNHPSVTVKGTPICCHPVCATDPGCDKETGGLLICGAVLGGCCEPSGFLQCGYAGPHDDCDN